MRPLEEQLPLPTTRLARWLVEVKGEVSPDIHQSLVRGLYGTLPIFIGGVVNTILVSSVIAARNPATPFLIWAAIEIVLAAIRLPLVVIGNRASTRGGRAYTDLYLMLAVVWAASVGYGSFISLMSGDWVAATLACLSGAAMVGGIAFRNFGAPRLVAVMIFLSLGPVAVGGLLSGELIMLATAFQIPVYMYAMTTAAYRMNAMWVRTMRSERENGHLARHDVLTGLLNRAGLEQEIAKRHARGDEAYKTTLFYLDLDGFKAVNDSLGHAAGDRLLSEVGERLTGLVRPDDLVARIGGDEFVIIARHAERAAAYRTGKRVVEELSSRPYFIREEAVVIGACVGVAIMPDHGEDFASLFAAADEALYRAKSSGRARCTVAAASGEGLRLASDRDEGSGGRRASGFAAGAR